MKDDISSYVNLVNAVVAKAITDTFLLPPKDDQISHETFTAFEFLFSNDVDVWLELIDIDPEMFKIRLKDSMWKDTSMSANKSHISESEKRAFRANYKKWAQKRAETKIYG